jgi:hypothetical protein
MPRTPPPGGVAVAIFAEIGAEGPRPAVWKLARR